MANEDMPVTCEANITAIKEFIRAEINELEVRLEQKYGKAKGRDHRLEGMINTLDMLVRTGFSDGKRRMESIEDWLKRQADERKKLERRIWNGRDSLEGRLRQVEGSQRLHTGKHIGFAAAAGVGGGVFIWIIYIILVITGVLPK